MKIIMHIDFNSYFATVEQQANPHLRGKPVGVTGGDRMKRTVLGAASIEAKKFGVKTGMQIWEAKKLCPQIILVPGDSDKYLETTKHFLNILKDYSPARYAGASIAGGPYLEVFSIDECFLEIESSCKSLVTIAKEIKQRIRTEIGEYITCSVGISYNRLMAKLAGSLQKPDGLVVILNQQEAVKILDQVKLDAICGIGPGIKKRLNNMGIFDFKTLRKVPLEALLASFKSYGRLLYNWARGIDHSLLTPFFEKEEVKSIGHRHTIDHDTVDPSEIKQILLKLSEMIAKRLRAKNLSGKTIHCWYRQAFSLASHFRCGNVFVNDNMQQTTFYTNDGFEIFKISWKIFQSLWTGEKIRMVGVSISNLKSQTPHNLSLLPEVNKQTIITQALDKINDKYGEFTLQRGTLLNSLSIKRKPNPFLADRRFKL